MPEADRQSPPDDSRARRIFVGDVQGCCDELEALLESCAFDPASDALYLVGDVINKGPASARALRLARSLDARCVLGNHEAALLERGAFAPTPPPGVLDRCPDLAEAPDRVELGAYVASWPWYRDLGDIFVVHAAVPPSLWRGSSGEVPREDERAFALSTRYCDARGARPPHDWPPPAEPFAPWHEFYEGSWTVVYGHWARQGLHIAPGLRGLDSGCVYGRNLTAWIAEEDRILQVQSARSESR